jgi:hypothetical protein
MTGRMFRGEDSPELKWAGKGRKEADRARGIWYGTTLPRIAAISRWHSACRMHPEATKTHGNLVEAPTPGIL